MVSVVVVSEHLPAVNFVLLAHFHPIKEYLTSSRDLQGPDAAFSFCETEAYFYIALSCFRYGKVGKDVGYRQMTVFFSEQNPLWIRTYTAAWNRLLETVSWKSWPIEVIDVVKDDLGATPRQALALRNRPPFLSGAKVMVSPWKPLYSRAAILGLCQATDMLVSTTEYLTQEDLDEALQDITSYRYFRVRPETKRIAEPLIDHGADVNGETEPFRDALHSRVDGERCGTSEMSS